MGREATAHCQWAHESGTCKVLIETRELILRGDLRRRVPLSQLSDLSVHEDQLRFRVDQDQVALHFGPKLAQRWAKALTAPPPTLAKKLSISPESRLLILGKAESPELKAAIAQGRTSVNGEADLILAVVNTTRDLDLALGQLPANPPPLWIVHPKGPTSNIGELAVLETLRQRGFTDTKVASVSPQFTARRFIKRR
jgi:hypothetical protein